MEIRTEMYAVGCEGREGAYALGAEVREAMAMGILEWCSWTRREGTSG